MHTIVNLFGTYAQASGETITFSKSFVVFSRNVGSITQECLSRFLGIWRVGKYDMYLGLPANVGKSQTIVFSSLQNKVWQRISGWNKKMLSQVGKGVLIKTVLQSILTYDMGVFLIPHFVIRDK
ncbi:UNVERIFIED_CONTAM: hypothetical protein Sradi_2514000 [Sesamum radiatum]|uniref:Uncharacterized protein n=1 Tax=Sesamum radiatum TaxID=300843 RepID=A0AAW2SKC5_SESRA